MTMDLRWRRYRDGQRRATIRVAHIFTEDDMLAVLCDWAKNWPTDDLPKLSQAKIMDGIRTQLALEGEESRMYWHEQVPEEDVEKIERWAAECMYRLTGRPLS